MSCYIPFLNTNDGIEILKEFYSDAVAVRVTLDKLPNLYKTLPKGQALWIDPAFEGFHHADSDRDVKWCEFIKNFEGWERFNDENFLSKPENKVVDKFVGQLLDATLHFKPRRLTIPQFPVGKSESRAKINRMLAESAGKWRIAKSFGGMLVLPLVITHRSQIKLAADKNKRIDHVRRCLSKVPFEAVWVVDSSLQDQHGTQNFEKERFPEIITLFESLRDAIGPDKHLCAGPHWGIQIVLWARGMINEPAIGPGTAFGYHVAGGKPYMPGDVRICLTPLRRWAVWSNELHTWLQETLSRTKQNASAHQAFSDLAKSWQSLADKKQARRQVARAYKTWFDLISSQPLSGRALALYQYLSSAYVLGKTLTDLPKDEGSAKRPERVAQQLMLNCL
jgi:hypothetical protein